ncbi:MAG: hypothetical protein U0990_04215 [Candidatus Nanopelagicales bacterium]|nr:hypothetical protein [Candidatus Nanopelagicales bacterium]MDZ7577917.1 hypothetical protein [Candidatus Nanopelagicales bacterium]
MSRMTAEDSGLVVRHSGEPSSHRGAAADRIDPATDLAVSERP